MLKTIPSRVTVLFKPLVVVVLAIAFGFITIARLIISFDIKPFFSWHAFKQQWFAAFWTFMGPIFAKSDEHISSAIIGRASGRVLDLGPGSGLTVKHFNRERIEKVYGVEPCVALHPLLHANIKSAGLADTYQVLSCGAEDLVKEGILPGSIDTIICCKVLCGIPDPERVLKELYTFLKPGGELVVLEHVRNNEDYIARKFQDILQIIWPRLLQGCNINRDTKKILMDAGEWEKVDLKHPEGEAKWDVIPHIVGRLVKVGAREPIPEMQIAERPDGVMKMFGDDAGYAMVIYLVVSYCFWGFVSAVWA